MNYKKLTVLFITSLFFSCQTKKDSCVFANEDLVYGEGKAYGYNTYHDLDKAITCSKKTQRKILLMFTNLNFQPTIGFHWSALDNEKVRGIIDDEYILVTLYTDDFNELLDIDSMKNNNNNIGEIKTVGDKNKFIQEDEYGGLTQPLFVVLNNALEVLEEPVVLFKESEMVSYLTVGK